MPRAKGRRNGAVGPANKNARERTANAPVAFAQFNPRPRMQTRSASNGAGDYAEVVITDRLGALAIAGTEVEGQVLFVQNLNPRTFTGTALEIESALWDRFRIKRITFYYCTSSPTSFAGSLLGGFDPDAQDFSAYTVGSVIPARSFAAHPTAAQCSVYSNMAWTYAAPPDLPFLYTRDTDPAAQTGATLAVPSHWTSPGIFALLANVGLAVANTGAGVMWYEAVYQFNGRNVEGAIQDFGAYKYTGASGVAATPFTGLTSMPYRAGVVNTLQTPAVVNVSKLEWDELDPSKAYYVRYYVDGGTTCSVAGTIAIDTYGTSVSTSNSFSTTASAASILCRPSAAGRLRLQFNQGTWSVYPTTGSLFLTSLNSANVDLLTSA
jgi:hypothetical protein